MVGILKLNQAIKCQKQIVSEHVGPVNANKASNDEIERREVAETQNEGSLSRTPTPSLAHRRRSPAIARTDC